MTITYVLMQNLKRNPLRTVLTAVAFALPMAIFVAAISFVVGLKHFSAQNQKELRLAVHHKTSIVNLLPSGMRRQIEAIDPNQKLLRAVCGMRWFGGRVPNTQNVLTSLAADQDTFPEVYSDVGVTPEEREKWNRDRQAAVVGAGPVEQFGWKLGDRVVLESTVPPYLQLEFHVVKIIAGVERANNFYFRRDYLDESLKAAKVEEGRVNIFWIKCQSAQAMQDLQNQIDGMFANSPDETKSEDENAFFANFTQALGDIPSLMQAMAVVVVFVIALVAGNTMMMSFRERMRELAVFKAIGFQSRRIFTIVLAESLMMALVGALAGIIPACLFLNLFPMQRMNMGMLGLMRVSPLAVAGSLTIALLVGLTAGLWPAIQALKLKTVDALRRVA
jgi:putative ABC transport system permease protein